jgi:hypothetical protein
MVYTAEPGSPTAERLQLLASWTAPSRTLADETPSTHPTAEAEGR